MTKKEAYLKLAKRYFSKNYQQLEFVCVDLKILLFGKKGDCEDLISVENFPELYLFRARKNKFYGAWMSAGNDCQENMEIKGWALLFCIEMLKDEAKIQKKSGNRSLRRLS